MPKEYKKEQYWKLYQELPEELKKVVFSEETARTIFDICRRNGIDDVSQISGYIQDVLLGILPLKDFQETLERETGLEKKLAEIIMGEINRFIFYPVKPTLEELYKIEISPPTKPPGISPPEKKPAAPPGKDVYREPIE